MADLCKRIDPETLLAFQEKRNNSHAEEQTAYNPLFENFQTEALLNDRSLKWDHSCSVIWDPCLPDGEENDLQARSVLEHYGLDPTAGWIFCRTFLPWPEKRMPGLRSLRLTLVQEPVAFPGESFRVSSPGDCISLTHPLTGAQHLLTVQEYTKRTLTDLPSETEFPIHYTEIAYSLSPNLPDNTFAVVDCASSDEPRRPDRFCRGHHFKAGANSIGIIGGADGPTAVFLAAGCQNDSHAAFSSLHFTPAESVDWKPIFYEKTKDDISVTLL